ncbi:MAG TPA: 2,6-beta-D-fructofuranosidase [Phycisphaerales bacterium]|nr:2,6-beta-D-fructofuranosidase [Phycisphaerales bacterium]
MAKTITTISSLCLLIFILSGCIHLAGRTSDGIVLIEDFETDSYGNWTTEGDAFGESPTEEDMVGVLGSRIAASINGSGVGTLTSPVFIIERNAIYLLVGAIEINGPPQKIGIELLVDGDVVRTTTPCRYHAMFWESWDVAELKGKKARIRIVDKDFRRPAFIFVDHIIQSNVPAKRPLLERTIAVTKPVLNFPLKTGAARHYIELVVDGKQIRAMDVELATGNDIDYWVVTDLNPWLGKELLMRTRQHPLGNAHVLARISVEDGIRDADGLYREVLRPQFHYSPKRGWISDTNGLIYYDGEFHLYYQHNPYGWDHSRNDYNKTWGHAVSTDLVHWKELAGAIHPDHLGTIYSGSAVLDKDNSAGFQKGKEKPIVAFYTSAGGRSPWSVDKKFSQSIAYSNNRGRTFTPYKGNPVLPNIEYINRDPKVIWHEPTGKWIMVLHFHERAMAFFTSDDLKSWEKQSEFETPYLIDCPELFQLAVDGDKHNKKWIIYGGSGAYYVGDFDGKEFKPETGITKYNHGDCFYASQTFSNVPKGRRVQMAWGVIPMEGMPFNQQLLFPVELTLHTTDEGLRMFAYPVKEIESIYVKEYVWTGIKLKPGQNIISGVKGELFDIDAEFETGIPDEFGFFINDFSVKYNVEKNQLSCEDSVAKLKPIDGKIRLRILVDRVSIEIFANDGRIYMPIRAIPESDERTLEVFTKAGNIKISSLKIRELKSIWK